MQTRAEVCRAFAAPCRSRPGRGPDPDGRLRHLPQRHSLYRRRWGGDLPAVYGHEAAGVVEAVGPGVTRLRLGDMVQVVFVDVLASAQPGAPHAAAIE